MRLFQLTVFLSALLPSEALVWDWLQCLLKLNNLGFAFREFERYPEWFNDDSVIILAQAGEYYGPDGIEEYVKFAYSEFSPYFTEGPIATRGLNFRGYDKDTDQCVFTLSYGGVYQLDPTATSSDDIIQVVYLAKVFLEYSTGKLPKINIYYPDGFLERFFDTYLNSDITRDYICSVMENNCESSIGTTPTTCRDDLAALPTAENGFYIDSNSQGCRCLHSAFASGNELHCAHIAFDATTDANGKVKCQTSENIQVSDLFDDEDIAMYESRCADEGIDPDIGFIVRDESYLTIDEGC